MARTRPVAASREERGAALVLVMAGMSFVLLILLVALSTSELANKIVKRQLTYHGQALNTASAGLTEALSWYRRQPQQPVVSFEPKRDIGACSHTPPHNPLVNDTEVESAGLVRTFEMSEPGRVYGRYSVLRTAVSDVSANRGKQTAGSIWQLESEGVVYVRNDATKAPEEAPNRVLARAIERSEIQRLGLQLPANAALSATEGRKVNVGNSARVLGGTGIGIAYAPSTGTPTVHGTVSGSPAQNQTTLPFSIDQIFGVSEQELLAMANLVVRDERDLPPSLPAMSLIVIRGNATFTPQRRLVGSGILVVLGNLIINPQSNSLFNGVIWVGGNFQQGEPATISGSVIANGNANLTGGADFSEIVYDAAIIDQVRLSMGNYRMSRSPYLVGGRP